MTARIFRRSVFLVILLSLWMSPTSAQYASDPPPVDSPYWWTLSDEVSPQELYDALQSRERNQSRLRQAILNGTYDAIPEGRIEDLSVFIDGRATPELFPMWEVFHAYSYDFDGLPRNYEATARDELKEAGVSAPGIARIVAVAHRNWREEEENNKALHPQRSRFVHEVLIPMDKTVGERGRNRAVMARDFGRMSRAAALDRGEVQDLYEAWKTDVAATVSIASVQELKASLSEEDWEALRAYLLREVASRRSIDYFSERPLR